MATRSTGSRKTADEPILKIEQLQDVLLQLPDFTQWENLGRNLGLSQAKLNVIEEDRKRNSDRLAMVIQEWLKRNYDEWKFGFPTWSNLVKAVKPIDNALAIKIWDKHCAVKDNEEEDESETEEDDETKIAKPKTLPKRRFKGSAGKTNKKQKVDSSGERAQPPSKKGGHNNEEEDESETEEDDETKIAKTKILPKRRFKGSAGKTNKKQKVDSSGERAQPPSKKGGHKSASSKKGPNADSDGHGSSIGLDCEPTDEDLEKFVATKVDCSDSLGTMLHLDRVVINMIKREEKDTVIMNKRILDRWMQHETRKPVTWRTVVEALRDMKMNRLARQLEEKFGH